MANKEFLSQRAKNVPRVGSRLWSEKANKYKESGVDVIRLSGAPIGAPGEHVLEAARKAVGDNGKSPSRGLLELREAIAVKVEKENGFSADPRTEILVTNGAMQALYIIMTGLLNPGDEVLMASPAFFFNGIIKLVGGIPVFVPMEEDDGFKLDINRFKEKITSRTKILVINTPANPTGYISTIENLEAMAAVAKEHNLIVLSDESYEKLVYDGRKHISIASLPGMKKRVITVQSFTKSYSMPAWRVGYLIADKELTKVFQIVLEWMVLNCNYVAQKAATAAITGPQDWVRQITTEFEYNRNCFMKEIGRMKNAGCVTPQGGPFLFFNISQFGMNPVEFSDYLLREYGIRTTPGPVFNSDEHVRIPFGGTKENVKEATQRLAAAVFSIFNKTS